MDKFHPVVTQIIDLLETNSCWYETFEHEPVRTSEEAAKIRNGYSIEQGAKAIIIRVKVSSANKRFVMLVMPGDQRFDNDKIKLLFQAKNIRFATEEEVVEITGGVQPGGVPPFGNLFDLEVAVDPLLLDNEKIIFNAGDRRFSVGMLSSDYLQLVKPVVSSLV
ncbi:MAG: hypothetical protein COY80_00935 [Candidatus Pacebacteria bacterium CG_4_10_14_0_8_um_filter_42_14]|nr:MAG: hypothetical protein COY80_00935 [Candidatus Pacebacteria bacterium CG_4_10_14_0_8_um_filter_42_14]